MTNLTFGPHHWPDSIAPTATNWADPLWLPANPGGISVVDEFSGWGGSS